ncbi:MAG: C4-type zinc ribbon domain-containing protein [Planctomycetota bacterium]
MNKDLELLRQLQDIDSRLRTIRIEQEAAPARAEAARVLVQQRSEELREIAGEAEKFQGKIDMQQNLDLKSKEGARAKLLVQLNTVKTNKEYAAIQSEIAGVEADISRLEDEILEMMTEAEARQKQLEIVKKRLDTAKAKLTETEKEIGEEIKRREVEEAELAAKREGIRAQVQQPYLDPYERLLNRRDGVALVSARNQVCQGCFINLTPQTTASLLTSDKPVFCNSCGRMLYLDEDDE